MAAFLALELSRWGLSVLGIHCRQSKTLSKVGSREVVSLTCSNLSINLGYRAGHCALHEISMRCRITRRNILIHALTRGELLKYIIILLGLHLHLEVDDAKEIHVGAFIAQG